MSSAAPVSLRNIGINYLPDRVEGGYAISCGMVFNARSLLFAPVPSALVERGEAPHITAQSGVKDDGSVLLAAVYPNANRLVLFSSSPPPPSTLTPPPFSTDSTITRLGHIDNKVNNLPIMRIVWGDRYLLVLRKDRVELVGIVNNTNNQSQVSVIASLRARGVEKLVSTSWANYSYDAIVVASEDSVSIHRLKFDRGGVGFVSDGESVTPLSPLKRGVAARESQPDNSNLAIGSARRPSISTIDFNEGEALLHHRVRCLVGCYPPPGAAGEGASFYFVAGIEATPKPSVITQSFNRSSLNEVVEASRKRDQLTPTRRGGNSQEGGNGNWNGNGVGYFGGNNDRDRDRDCEAGYDVTTTNHNGNAPPVITISGNTHEETKASSSSDGDVIDLRGIVAATRGGGGLNSLILPELSGGLSPPARSTSGRSGMSVAMRSACADGPVAGTDVSREEKATMSGGGKLFLLKLSRHKSKFEIVSSISVTDINVPDIIAYQNERVILGSNNSSVIHAFKFKLSSDSLALEVTVSLLPNQRSKGITAYGESGCIVLIGNRSDVDKGALFSTSLSNKYQLSLRAFQLQPLPIVGAPPLPHTSSKDGECDGSSSCPALHVGSQISPVVTASEPVLMAKSGGVTIYGTLDEIAVDIHNLNTTGGETDRVVGDRVGSSLTSLRLHLESRYQAIEKALGMSDAEVTESRHLAEIAALKAYTDARLDRIEKALGERRK